MGKRQRHFITLNNEFNTNSTHIFIGKTLAIPAVEEEEGVCMVLGSSI